MHTLLNRVMLGLIKFSIIIKFVSVGVVIRFAYSVKV